MCSVQELGQHCEFPYVCHEGSALYALSHFDSFKLPGNSLDLYGAHESISIAIEPNSTQCHTRRKDA